MALERWPLDRLLYKVFNGTGWLVEWGVNRSWAEENGRNIAAGLPPVPFPVGMEVETDPAVYNRLQPGMSDFYTYPQPGEFPPLAGPNAEILASLPVTLYATGNTAEAQRVAAGLPEEVKDDAQTQFDKWVEMNRIPVPEGDGILVPEDGTSTNVPPDTGGDEVPDDTVDTTGETSGAKSLLKSPLAILGIAAVVLLLMRRRQ